MNKSKKVINIVENINKLESIDIPKKISKTEFNEKNKKFSIREKKIKKVSDKFKKTKAPKTLWVRRKKAS